MILRPFRRSLVQDLADHLAAACTLGSVRSFEPAYVQEGIGFALVRLRLDDRVEHKCAEDRVGQLCRCRSLWLLLERWTSCWPECTASSFLPCFAVNQFPTRTPSRLAPLTRRMPAARSGLRSPQSEASYASLRTAASLRLIVEGA